MPEAQYNEPQRTQFFEMYKPGEHTDPEVFRVFVCTRPKYQGWFGVAQFRRGHDEPGIHSIECWGPNAGSAFYSVMYALTQYEKGGMCD